MTETESRELSTETTPTLRILFISSSDPFDVRSFSGVLLHMVQALKVVFPSLEVVQSSRPFWFRRFQRLVLHVSDGKIDPYYWRPLNRWFARRLARRWHGERVLVISAVNAALVGELAAYVPVLNVTDSTFELMRDYYQTFSKLDAKTAEVAEEDELHSIVRSVHNSFSSRWAAQSAIHHYGAAPENVSVISWGCNLDYVGTDKLRSASPSDEVCRLLFIGGDWARKGGDVVCAAAEDLIGRGIPVRVDIVGSAPTSLAARPWLNDHGFLSKADSAQFDCLRTLMRDAHFLFLPTRQDCTPMVFAEANAYGTPAVTRDVGGVADVVRHGFNGLVLPKDAAPSDFADAIEAAWRNQEEYAQLRQRARLEYEGRLNWGSWARAIEVVVKSLELQGRL